MSSYPSRWRILGAYQRVSSGVCIFHFARSQGLAFAYAGLVLGWARHQWGASAQVYCSRSAVSVRVVGV